MYLKGRLLRVPATESPQCIAILTSQPTIKTQNRRKRHRALQNLSPFYSSNEIMTKAALKSWQELKGCLQQGDPLTSTGSNRIEQPRLDNRPLDCRPERIASLLCQAGDLQPEMQRIRRSIHENPELAYREFATANLAAKKLEALGFRIIADGIAGSGFYADLGTGRSVAIRAGMDGQELLELNRVDYCSRVANVMHACGHDANLAAVLGAAEILSRQRLQGQVRIILQPGEESADEAGHTGSFHMIQAGALKNQKAILGLHVDTTLAAGKIGIITRPIADLAAGFSIKLSNCHEPEYDCLDSACRLLPLLKELRLQLIWRNAKMEIQEIHAGSENSQISITGRLLSNSIMIDSLKDAFAASCKAVFKDEFLPEVKLDGSCHSRQQAVTEEALSAARSVCGAQAIPLTRLSWTKDFAAYASQVPSAFLLIGAQVNAERVIHQSATFDLDESILTPAAATLAEIALRLLESDI
jgi:amidohydrolase